ncbi:MAG: hypothetical protein AB7U79_07775 [Candidatus Izemoplasmatales bacterium]
MHLRFLDIYGIVDASQIPAITNMKFLRVHSYTPIVLSKFPNLEWISTSTPNKLEGIETLNNLKSITVIGGNDVCSQRILDIVGKIPTVDTLQIERSEMEDLSFIRNLPNLRVLILMNNTRLKNIEAISNVSNSLQSVKIFLSSKILSFSYLSNLKSLEHLYIDSRNKISDLSFINSLPNLKTAVFANTNILDGNLSPLMKLEYGRAIPIKRHYYFIQNGRRRAVKIEDFPFSKVNYNNQSIDLWRQIETW